MRTIKFRGKNIETGKLVYGFYTQGGYIREDGTEKVRHIIHSDILYDVEKNTIDQYTGLQDKNGIEIYEGDILVMCDEDYRSQPIIVVFKHGSFGYIYSDYWFTFNPLNIDIHFEVIGNIHDNPELLKGE
jgi:hypothetical protein